MGSTRRKGAGNGRKRGAETGTHISCRVSKAPAGWVHQFGVGSAPQNNRRTLVHCLASQIAAMPTTRPTFDAAGGAGFGNALSDARTQRQFRVNFAAQAYRRRSTCSLRWLLKSQLGRQQLTSDLADVKALSTNATTKVVDAMRLAGNRLKSLPN